MSDIRYDALTCITLLKHKQDELRAMGEDRLPRRSDFNDSQVVAIKAFLGPWPRALEKAGLKSERTDDRKQLNLEKRIRSKRRRYANSSCEGQDKID